MAHITDQDRMNFLEKIFSHNQNGIYNRVVLRQSITGKGMRLHHTYDEEFKSNFATVREAVDEAIESGIE